jgi:hypothetical protein
MLLALSEMRSPRKTPIPLKASVLVPGIYGYAMTIPKTQMMAVKILEVGGAASGSSQVSTISPFATFEKNIFEILTNQWLSMKIIKTTNRLGRDSTTLDKRLPIIPMIYPPSFLPHGSVYGNWCRANVINVYVQKMTIDQ